MLENHRIRTVSFPTGIIFPAIFVIWLVVAGGCIFDNDDNGHKPDDGNPAVTNLNISEGDTIRTRDFLVKWKGNAYAREYKVTFDGAESAWFDSTSWRLTDLSEGAHIFSVQARNDSLLSEPLIVHFAVDASKGTGLRLSPNTISVTSSVSIFLEDAVNLMAIHIEIACPDSSARMKEFVASTPMTNMECIVFSDSKDPYRLILDIGFPGIEQGFTGSIELGSFLASPLKSSGEISVDPAKTHLRDTNNMPLVLESAGSMRIER